jgi:hypothetical protein
VDEVSLEQVFFSVLPSVHRTNIALYSAQPHEVSDIQFHQEAHCRNLGPMQGALSLTRLFGGFGVKVV